MERANIYSIALRAKMPRLEKKRKRQEKTHKFFFEKKTKTII